MLSSNKMYVSTFVKLLCRITVLTNKALSLVKKIILSNVKISNRRSALLASEFALSVMCENHYSVYKCVLRKSKFPNFACANAAFLTLIWTTGRGPDSYRYSASQERVRFEITSIDE